MLSSKLWTHILGVQTYTYIHIYIHTSIYLSTYLTIYLIGRSICLVCDVLDVCVYIYIYVVQVYWKIAGCATHKELRITYPFGPRESCAEAGSNAPYGMKA